MVDDEEKEEEYAIPVVEVLLMEDGWRRAAVDVKAPAVAVLLDVVVVVGREARGRVDTAPRLFLAARPPPPDDDDDDDADDDDDEV